MDAHVIELINRHGVTEQTRAFLDGPKHLYIGGAWVGAAGGAAGEEFGTVHVLDRRTRVHVGAGRHGTNHVGELGGGVVEARHEAVIPELGVGRIAGVRQPGEIRGRAR